MRTMTLKEQRELLRVMMNDLVHAYEIYFNGKIGMANLDEIKKYGAAMDFIIDCIAAVPEDIRKSCDDEKPQPTKQELLRFIEVFDALCNFEALQRAVRSQGVFNPKDLPIPEVVKVLAWLKGKTDE
jgi:hypothetical protein